MIEITIVSILSQNSKPILPDEYLAVAWHDEGRQISLGLRCLLLDV